MIVSGRENIFERKNLKVSMSNSDVLDEKIKNIN